MKKPVLLILLNAIILVGVFSLLANSLVVVQRVATVRVVAGRVTLQHNQSSGDLVAQQTGVLRAGDMVTTDGAAVADVLWADGTRLRLTSGSQLVLQRALYNSHSQAEDTHLLLNSGTAFLRVVHDHARYSHFTVETPQLLADFGQGVYKVCALDAVPGVQNYRGRVTITRTGCATGATLEQNTLFRSQAGSCQVTTAPADTAAFAKEPTISLPPVEVEVQLIKNNAAVVHVVSENGVGLRLDGILIKASRPGEWDVPVPVKPGVNRWSVACTDGFGATHQLEESFLAEKSALGRAVNPAAA